MAPEVILWELSKIQIGDIVMETTAGRQLAYLAQLAGCSTTPHAEFARRGR